MQHTKEVNDELNVEKGEPMSIEQANGGHTICVERRADGSSFVYDPQTGRHTDIENMGFTMGVHEQFIKPNSYVFRVDNCTFVAPMLDGVVTKYGTPAAAKTKPVKLKGLSGADITTTYKSKSGASVSTSNQRLVQAKKSKNETIVYAKEMSVCRFLADNGLTIQHISTDTARFDILINGHRADIKCTTSANNILKYAKKAIREQNAEIVVFRFSHSTPAINNEINKLRRLGYKCYYYYGSKNKLYSINL